MTALVTATDLKRSYEIKQGWFRKPAHLQAVGGVSFALEAGKTLAVVGESGCGKSTLARLVTLIEKPSAGTLMLDGVDAVNPPASAVKTLRRTVQIVFQNPYGSLNPRKRVGHILEEPLIINTRLSKQSRRAQALDMMAKVGLRPEQYGRYPHMFSGGQRPAHRNRARLDVAAEAARCRLSLCPHSTCRCRRRFSTSWPICSANWGWLISSSRTISPWCVTSPKT
jgi:dipeptide transport system ATP-binding protein